MTMRSIVNPHDIRGIWGKTLTPDTVTALAHACITYLVSGQHNTTLIIGRDGRLSSDPIYNLFATQCAAHNIDVINLGVVPSEVVYYATIRYNAPAVMITASHNPSDYNGFKFMQPNAAPVGEDTGLYRIRDLAETFLTSPVELPIPSPNPQTQVTTSQMLASQVQPGQSQSVGSQSAIAQSGTNRLQTLASQVQPGHSQCVDSQSAIAQSGTNRLQTSTSQVQPAQSQSVKSMVNPQEIPRLYRDYVLGFFPRLLASTKKRKIVVDYSNGVASVMTAPFFRQLPVNVVEINKDIDGTFPNHPPNPVEPQNVTQLSQAVQDNHADFGICFDGDGDRMMFVNERGHIVDAAHIQALLVSEILAQYPGSRMVYSEVSSQLVPSTITQLGGTPIAAPVGHSAIKNMVRTTQAIAAVEHSGHYYFASLNGADSSMTALCYILQAAVLTKRPFSRIVKPAVSWHATGEINWSANDIPAIMNQLETELHTQASSTADYRVNQLLGGGLAMVGGQTYATIRRSNTENLIRLCLESPNPQDLEDKKQHFSQLLIKLGANQIN